MNINIQLVYACDILSNANAPNDNLAKKIIENPRSLYSIHYNMKLGSFPQ